MGTMIRVKPSSANRRGFAQWAARNRVRTVESTTFGVPADLFGQIPENLLRGSVIDGQRYVPVASPKAAPAAAARKAKADPETPPSPAVATAAETPPVTPAETRPENIPAVASPLVSASKPVEEREVLPRRVTIGASIQDVSLPDEPLTAEPEPVPPQRTSRGLPAPVESPQRVCHCGHVAATAHGLKVHVGKAHNDGGDA